MAISGEKLREIMRLWASGVTIVTSIFDGKSHGMTVNSFNSISLDPPLVTVTLANHTRTHQLVSLSNVFGISILEESQKPVSDLFAGKRPEQENRYSGLEVFSLLSGCPFINGSLGFLDCRVVYKYPMASSTLFIGEVMDGQWHSTGWPLVYMKRDYFKVAR